MSDSYTCMIVAAAFFFVAALVLFFVFLFRKMDRYGRPVVIAVCALCVFLSLLAIHIPVLSGFGGGGVFNAMHSSAGTFALENSMNDCMEIWNDRLEECFIGELAERDVFFRMCSPSAQESMASEMLAGYSSMPERWAAIMEYCGIGPGCVAWLLWALIVMLFIAAPMFTAAAIISLFKGLTANVRLHWHRRSDIYFFSALNEKTVCLAKSLEEKRREMIRKEEKARKDGGEYHALRKNVYAFFGVDSETRKDSGLLDEVRELHGIVFSSDIDRYGVYRWNRRRSFYWICAAEKEDEDGSMVSDDQKNIGDAVSIRERFERTAYEKVGHGADMERREDTQFKKEREMIPEAVVYVISHSSESGFLFTASCEDEKKIAREAEKKKASDDENKNSRMIPYEVRVARKDPARNIIWNYLWNNGSDIIDAAYAGKETGEINVCIAGLGHEGMLMMRSMLWLFQRPGCRFRMHLFDGDPDIEKKLAVQCPEIFSPDLKVGGKDGAYVRKASRVKIEDMPVGFSEQHDCICGTYEVPSDTEYEISVYPGVSFDSSEFSGKIADIDRAEPLTFVFTALPSNEENISASKIFRSCTYREGEVKNARITSFVRNVLDAAPMQNVCCDELKSDKWNITFIGDVKNSWNSELLSGSEVELKALARHSRTRGPLSFWLDEYKYHSACARELYWHVHDAYRPEGSVLEDYHDNLARLKNTADPEDRLKLIEDAHLSIIRYGRAIVEHDRWNTYMRSEGWQDRKGYDNGKLYVPRLHANIKPWDALIFDKKYYDFDIFEIDAVDADAKRGLQKLRNVVFDGLTERSLDVARTLVTDGDQIIFFAGAAADDPLRKKASAYGVCLTETAAELRLSKGTSTTLYVDVSKEAEARETYKDHTRMKVMTYGGGI